MKTILFLLIISSLEFFITFSSCQDDFAHEIITNLPPKKVKKMQILNPRKFLKVKSNENRKWNLKKRVSRSQAYTVFPAIAHNQEHIGVPDSPFFQPEQDIEQKTRVKKVLPDYLFTLNRRKRDIGNDGGIDSIKNITQRITDNRRKSADIPATKLNKKLTQNKAKTVAKKTKLRHQSRIVDAGSTAKLKYTEKNKKNRKRVLRNRKRAEKERRREQRTQKKYDNIEKNSRKRKRPEAKESRRLIAGRDAMIADYPYVVSIQKGNEHWCAGALLNPRLVITTANCVWKSDRVSRLKVRAGSRHSNRDGQMAKIQEVMKHPSWSIRGTPDNDVALLLLDRFIRFSDRVHSVDLPNHAMMPAFEDAWVTSWGAERRDGLFVNNEFTLQVYNARLMDREKCNNVTKRFGVIVSENFICLTQSGRRAPCTRDTGAPAVSDGVLWGLASWGIRKLCGTERFPAMFTYVASQSNLDFITNATRGLMSEHRHYPFPDWFTPRKLTDLTTLATPNYF